MLLSGDLLFRLGAVEGHGFVTERSVGILGFVCATAR